MKGDLPLRRDSWTRSSVSVHLSRGRVDAARGPQVQRAQCDLRQAASSLSALPPHRSTHHHCLSFLLTSSLDNGESYPPSQESLREPQEEGIMVQWKAHQARSRPWATDFEFTESSAASWFNTIYVLNPGLCALLF